jgi:hypothetical protein
MTGTPAWSDHSDEELWATVAFVEKLPGMKFGASGSRATAVRCGEASTVL